MRRNTVTQITRDQRRWYWVKWVTASASTVAKQATSRRIALSGWQNKVDGVDTVDDVDEVDDTMVEEILVEMVADTILAVMEDRPTPQRPMPTWLK